MHFPALHAQVVFRQLGAAGLERSTLMQLARTAAEQHLGGDDGMTRFRTLAERLYGGDWHAAALRFLREKQRLVGCLCRLKPVLDRLDELGFKLANQRGRERVLSYVKGRPETWSISIPAGTPDSERLVAAHAALEQQGFEAAGAVAQGLLDRLATVSRAGGQRCACSSQRMPCSPQPPTTNATAFCAGVLQELGDKDCSQW